MLVKYYYRLLYVHIILAHICCVFYAIIIWVFIMMNNLFFSIDLLLRFHSL